MPVRALRRPTVRSRLPFRTGCAMIRRGRVRRLRRSPPTRPDRYRDRPKPAAETPGGPGAGTAARRWCRPRVRRRQPGRRSPVTSPHEPWQPVRPYRVRLHPAHRSGPLSAAPRQQPPWPPVCTDRAASPPSARWCTSSLRQPRRHRRWRRCGPSTRCPWSSRSGRGRR